jgi:hypothetical protein
MGHTFALSVRPLSDGSQPLDSDASSRAMPESEDRPILEAFTRGGTTGRRPGRPAGTSPAAPARPNSTAVAVRPAGQQPTRLPFSAGQCRTDLGSFAMR